MAFLAALPEILGEVGAAGAAEGAGAAAEGAGAAEGVSAAEGAGSGLDFNDAPVGNTTGSQWGRRVVSQAAQHGTFQSHPKGGGAPGSDPSMIGPIANI